MLNKRGERKKMAKRKLRTERARLAYKSCINLRAHLEFERVRVKRQGLELELRRKCLRRLLGCVSQVAEMTMARAECGKPEGQKATVGTSASCSLYPRSFVGD
jgi:hypothetical protein